MNNKKHPTKNAIDKLKAQRATLDARIQAAEARAKVSERKQETRRKILIGSYYLDHAKKHNRMPELIQLMDTYLTRQTDRKLFGLAERTEKEE